MLRRAFFISAILLPALTLLAASQWIHALWAFVLWLPLMATGLHDVLQTRHSLLRIYPVIGHGRYLMEMARPEIQQYFVESNLDGMSLQEITQAGAKIAYVEKFSAEAKQRLEKMKGEGMTMPMMMEDPAMTGRLVAEVPEELGTYPEFHGLSTQPAMMLHQAFLEECSDGSRPEQCMPGK